MPITTTQDDAPRTPPRDLGVLMPAMAPAIRPITWLDPHDCADQRNTTALALGKAKARRFTGEPMTGFGGLL